MLRPAVSKTLQIVGVLLALLAPGPSVAATLTAQTASWTDSNANGSIDCAELVTVRLGLFESSSDPATVTLIIPTSATRWTYLPGSVRIDPTLNTDCAIDQVVTGGPGDSRAEVRLTCTPNTGNYSAVLLVDGTYLSQTAGPIIVNASGQVDANPLLTTSLSEPRTTPCPAPPDLRTSKGVQSGNFTPGSTAVYAITVTNFGNGAAPSSSLTETVPPNTTFAPAASTAGWSCSSPVAGSSCSLALGNIAPNASRNVLFAVTLAPSLPANVATISNTACAVTANDTNPGNDCSTVTTPAGGQPDLAVAKRLQSGQNLPGATLVYAIDISNIGNRDAAGVTLSEQLPAGATFSPSSSSSGWTCSGSSCSLAVGTVVAGTTTTRTFAFTLSNTQVSAIDNTACAAAAGDSNPDNNCGSVTTPPFGAPDVAVTKALTTGTNLPGQTLTYTLQVANVGTGAAAGILLTEHLPSGSTFSPASSSAGWACSGSLCSLTISVLPPATTTTRTFAFVLPDSPAAAVTNLACSSTPRDTNPANDCGTVTTPPAGTPEIRIDKTLASGTAVPGATLVWNITITNAGSATTSTLTVTDDLYGTWRPDLSSPTWSCSPSPCTASLATLAPGASVTLTLATDLPSPFPPLLSQIVNTACVEDRAQPTKARVCDTVNVPLGRVLTDLELELRSTNANLSAGGRHQVALSLRNTSDIEANGVRVLVLLGDYASADVGDLPAACSLLPTAIECDFGQVTPTIAPTLTWTLLARAGAHTLSAEIIEGSPEDLDSTPNNHVQGEDDSADLTLTGLGSTATDIPTLDFYGLLALCLTLAAAACFFLRRRRTA